MTFDATYDPADDKLRLRASSRLDAETYTKVKEGGFGWAPKQDLFYAVWTPAREDLLVELAGEIGDEETSPADRAAQRADRFSTYQGKRAADAEQARKSVSAIADGIPLGQPILVGHHSERHARRDAERIESGMRKATKLWDTSQYWQDRAAGAIAHARYLEQPAVRARRIKKIEAELRGYQRDTDKAEKALELWAVEPLTLERAKAITNVNHYSMCFPLSQYPREPPTSQYEGQQSFWSALQDGIITAEQARTLAVPMNQRGIAHRSRWIAHLENRLAYERAMLGESGGLKADKFDLQPGGQVLRRGHWHVIMKVNRSAGAVRSVTVLGHFAATIAVEDIADYRAPADGVAEKVKAATKLAPLCNYPGEGFRHMTRAEWEHKKMSDVPQAIRHKANEKHGAHRTRATSGGAWMTVAVYLTDMKRVDPPAPSAPKPVPQIETLPPEPSTPPAPQASDPVAEDFAALKAALKAGVKVISAPQLFPTPPALAGRMVELADLRPGLCVLEPSAGTGNIVRAVLDAVDTEVLAYEINRDLCSQLERTFPSWKLQARCKDFLEVTDFMGQYERILMNPPFHNGADVVHILHALKFLKPGGRLAALDKATRESIRTCEICGKPGTLTRRRNWVSVRCKPCLKVDDAEARKTMKSRGGGLRFSLRFPRKPATTWFNDIIVECLNLPQCAEDMDFTAFKASRPRQAAALRHIHQIAEAAFHQPASVRRQYRAVNWKALIRLKERTARMAPREIWNFVSKDAPALLEKLADNEGLLVARKRLRDRDRLLSIKDINRLLREGRRRSRRKAEREAAEARADARDARIAERRIAELDAGRVRAISSAEMRERLGLGPRGDKPQTPYSHRYHFVFWLEDEIWSAKAPSVRGVYGVGPTVTAAKDDLVEALKAMSDHLEDVGESKKAAVCDRLVKAWKTSKPRQRRK